jgi:hypothetical protein
MTIHITPPSAAITSLATVLRGAPQNVLLRIHGLDRGTIGITRNSHDLFSSPGPSPPQRKARNRQTGQVYHVLSCLPTDGVCLGARQCIDRGLHGERRPAAALGGEERRDRSRTRVTATPDAGRSLSEGYVDGGHESRRPLVTPVSTNKKRGVPRDPPYPPRRSCRPGGRR